MALKKMNLIQYIPLILHNLPSQVNWGCFKDVSVCNDDLLEDETKKKTFV